MIETRDVKRIPFYRSGVFKVGLCAAFLTLVSVLLFTYFTIRSLRAQMVEEAQERAFQLSETLVGSMRHSMMRNDAEAIENVIQTIGRQKGVSGLRVINKFGKIRFTTEGQEARGTLDKGTEGCAGCHAKSPASHMVTPSERVRTYRAEEGQRILQTITPIYNERACSSAACHAHDEKDRVLGILDVGISLQEMDDAVSHAVRKTIVFSLLLFSGIAALLAFGLVRFVAKPVRKLTEAANRISLGEYGRRVEVSSGDELGHLADSFNRMSEGIQQRQTEVERSRNEFQILFESVPTSIAVVDRNFRIVRTNQDFKDTFGEHEGANCCSAYKGLGEACLMDCPVSQTLRDKTLHRCEEHGVTKEGEIIHYFVHTAPVLNPGGEVEYVVRASLDLRETKRLERELRASREFLDKLVENSIHGIVAVDPEGEAIIFNRSAERILGYRADEALGQRALARFFPKEFVEMLESDGRAAEEAVDGKMVARETWVRAKSGERVPVRFSGVVLREDGSAAGAVGFFQDLRRFRTLEEEKRQAERLALVGQTVVALAHEIKNILTGLEGGVYVTRTAMRSEDDLLLQKGWDMVERNIEKVSHLVKDLLGFSKLRTSERMWLNPNELAEEVGTLFEEKARQLGIELVMDLAPDMDEAFLDPRTTHMCLNNLLSNAMDACMEDRAKEHHRIVVRTRGAKEEWVTFEIRDDGKGMDEDVKKKIFAGFFTTKEAKGTGLGLMVTQQIIHEQGGRISFQTEPGQGSVFRVAFPRAQVALEKAEPVSAQVN